MVGGRSLQVDTGLGCSSGAAGEVRQEQTLSKGAWWGGGGEGGEEQEPQGDCVSLNRPENFSGVILQ